MKRPTRGALTTLVIAVTAVMVAACAGPRVPLQVGVQDFASNVQFGAPNILTPAPLPPVAMAIPPPSLSPLPVAAPAVGPGPTTPPEPTTLAPVVGPCPAASPFAVAALSSVNDIPAPPAPATYVYRDTGTYQTSGANPEKGTYPTVQTRTVSASTKTVEGGFSFNVTTTLGDTVTTTGYTYMPPTAASQTQAGALPIAGLYITKVSTQVGTQAASTFSPLTPGLLLLEMPAEAGDTWNSVGVDPTTATTMLFTGTQGADKLINACGQVLDAIPVHINGEIEISEDVAGVVPTSIVTGINPGGKEIGLDTNTTFTADYDIVDQYGGLSVMDDVDTTGTEQGVGVNRVLTSTIDVVPKAP